MEVSDQIQALEVFYSGKGPRHLFKGDYFGPRGALGCLRYREIFTTARNRTHVPQFPSLSLVTVLTEFSSLFRFPSNSRDFSEACL